MAVLHSADGRIYSRLSAVPFERVGLVLGTSPILGGHKNAFFEHRMDEDVRYSLVSDRATGLE